MTVLSTYAHIVLVLILSGVQDIFKLVGPVGRLEPLHEYYIWAWWRL